MRIVDFIAEQLATKGVRHVFGVDGANIEDMFAAVQRRRPAMRAMLSKHEHAAGTAADAYARLTELRLGWSSSPRAAAR
jgi:acetolactate synthase-1/2/3 large subunit